MNSMLYSSPNRVNANTCAVNSHSVFRSGALKKCRILSLSLYFHRRSVKRNRKRLNLICVFLYVPRHCKQQAKRNNSLDCGALVAITLLTLKSEKINTKKRKNQLIYYPESVKKFQINSPCPPNERKSNYVVFTESDQTNNNLIKKLSEYRLGFDRRLTNWFLYVSNSFLGLVNDFHLYLHACLRVKFDTNAVSSTSCDR